MAELFDNHRRLIDQVTTCRTTGRVVEVTGLTVMAEGFCVAVGSLGMIQRECAGPIAAQVVGARGDCAILMTLQDPLGVSVGDAVTSTAGLQHVPVGRRMLGTVLNGLGERIGGRGDFTVETHVPVYRDVPPALSRIPIREALPTGIRAIDALVSGRVKNQTINLANGQGSSLVDLVNIIGMAINKTPNVTYEPSRAGEVTRYVADITKARELLDYEPATPLTAGLPKAIAWQREIGFLKD